MPRHSGSLRAIHSPAFRMWPIYNIFTCYVSFKNVGYIIKYLEINHFTGLWGLRTITSVKHRNTVFLDLLFEITKLTFHFIATTYLIHELTLEGVHIGIELQIFVEKLMSYISDGLCVQQTYITKLH